MIVARELMTSNAKKLSHFDGCYNTVILQYDDKVEMKIESKDYF